MPIARCLTLACVLLAALTACSTLNDTADRTYSVLRASAPDTVEELEIEHAGSIRRARIVYPPRYGQRQMYPVLIDLHDAGNDGGFEMRASGMAAAAHDRGFIAVFPDGVGAGQPGGPAWNAGPCCGYAQRSESQDLAFLNALITRLIADHRADPKRVYIVGCGNGAQMACRLACGLSHRLAGIGLVDGALTVPNCRPVKPIPLIAIHYAPDAELDSVVEFWTRNNGCLAPETTSNAQAQRTLHADPVRSADLLLYQLSSPGKGWPGGDPDLALSPTNSFPAATVIVDFFANRPGRQAP